jgi:hypothetical protein
MFREWILIGALALASTAQPPPTTGQPKFRINGTVVDAVSSEKLPGIEISIVVSQAESVLKTLITGPDSRFEFDDLAPAKYALYGHGLGYRPQGYQEHQRFTTAIVTGPRLDSENLIFRLKREASISGVVTDEFGDPVPLAEVLLFASVTEAAQATVFRRKATASDAGYFQFSHLGDGKYFLVVTARPWYARDNLEEGEQTSVLRDDDSVAPEEPSRSTDAPASGVHRHSELDVVFQTRYYVNATEPELATPIVLKPGERATADLHLFAVPAVHLKVRAAPAFPSAVGSLTLWERIFSYSRKVVSQSIDQGELEFNSLAPGRYVLESPPQDFGGLSRQQPLDLVADAEILAGESSKFASTVTGTVELESNGGPCQRCNVRLVSLAGEEFVARSTSKGFQIDGGVRPGSYIVWVLNAESYLIKDISAVGAKVVGKQIEMRAGANVRLSIVMTKDAGTIDGLALREGKPVSEAWIFLVPSDPAHNIALFRGDQSDSDGTFTLRRILPGEYTVVAVDEGWNLEWTNPAALKPYLGGGVKLRVQPSGKHRVELVVQTSESTPK